MGKKVLVFWLLTVVAVLISGCFTAVNEAPVAAFEYIINAFKVEFDASASSDVDGNIVNYKWYFGDGETGVGETITHKYAGDGEYDVRLVVFDNAGDSDDAFKSIQVGDQTPSFVEKDPIARFSYVIDGFDVLFNGGSSNDPDGGDIKYGYWDFGDGNSIEGGWFDMTANGPVNYVVHTYAQTGSYTVALLVKDNEGSLGRKEKEIVVE